MKPHRRRKTDLSLSEEQENHRQDEEVVKSMYGVWNLAIAACIRLMRTRWDDHDLIAKMRKLKK